MKTAPLGLILLIVGALLLAFGIMAADSIASGFSRLFTGKPTDKAIFLIVAGVVSLGAGLFITMMPRRA